ncbi:ComEC/Rec2 family competence protein [Patescibacteria group bacterium]|nr:MAG: ComEC/Rec2 family competence protein [Patescibacteria group bacterium]
MGSASRLEALASSPSKSLALVLSAFCLGIALGPLLAVVSPAFTWIVAILLAAFALSVRSRSALLACVMAAAFGFGAARTFAPALAIPVPPEAAALREWIGQRMAAALPEPYAGFLTGLIFGGSSALPDGLREAFRTTGLSHILSASGSNVALTTFIFFNFVITTPLGRRWGTRVTAALLLLYVFVAGAGAAIVRAAIMGSVVLLGETMRRRASPHNALLLAATLMLAFDPTLLREDIGFQLSIAATYAMMAWAGPVGERLAFLPERFGLRESLAGSLAAIAITMPIVLWHFGTVSLIAPIANLVVLPLVPYAIASGIIALAASITLQTLPTLITLLALPAWALSSLMLHVVSWLDAVPHASVSVPNARVLALISTVPLLFLWRRLRSV